MAQSAPICIKRMTREKATLSKPSPDYFVHIPDSNLLRFSAYVVGTPDTLYAHKFVRIDFTIPPTYPFRPPQCKYLQRSGHRIHPNLYHDCGKVCLSILGTWPGEPWSQAMHVESILITLRSLLDNSPYQHEPNQRDNPAFNGFVEHSTWRCLLLDHLAHETDPHARAFLRRYVACHGDEMLAELARQRDANRGVRTFTSPYYRRGIKPEYEALLKELGQRVEEARCWVEENPAAPEPEAAEGRAAGGAKADAAPEAPGAVQQMKTAEPPAVEKRPPKRKAEVVDLT